MNGTDIEFTATHEIGHALGLDHVPSEDAVMNKRYPEHQKDFSLHHDDIAAIQNIYGYTLFYYNKIHDNKMKFNVFQVRNSRGSNQVVVLRSKILNDLNITNNISVFKTMLNAIMNVR